ncbi:MAG: hypothetical protein JXA69_04405 [Phycisphaerae bacterium]|nr:hypothetical protein [Phycisphaerae bacterium]
MPTKRIFACPAILATLVVFVAAPAHGQNSPPPAVPVLIGGFADHLQPVTGGRIDWAHGVILAEGRGKAEADTDQQRLMAQRAAEVTAARNALAIAKGIRIDAAGRVGDVRHGLLRLDGVIRGHRTAEIAWLPNVSPPQCRATVRVPLWGVRGVATIFEQAQRIALRSTVRHRLILTSTEVEVADFVLVLDARGRNLAPSLFPVVRDAQGRVLYDLTALPVGTAARMPPVRYVETELQFEALRTMVEYEPPEFRLAQYTPPTAVNATSAPTSQPDEPTRRRAKRRMAVRVQDVTGDQKTELVLTEEDAERLRSSPEATSAMKRAQVLVVVDAAAAGTEGRGPAEPLDSLAIAWALE